MYICDLMSCNSLLANVVFFTSTTLDKVLTWHTSFLYWQATIVSGKIISYPEHIQVLGTIEHFFRGSSVDTDLYGFVPFRNIYRLIIAWVTRDSLMLTIFNQNLVMCNCIELGIPLSEICITCDYNWTFFQGLLVMVCTGLYLSEIYTDSSLRGWRAIHWWWWYLIRILCCCIELAIPLSEICNTCDYVFYNYILWFMSNPQFSRNKQSDSFVEFAENGIVIAHVH